MERQLAIWLTELFHKIALHTFGPVLPNPTVASNGWMVHLSVSTTGQIPDDLVDLSQTTERPVARTAWLSSTTSTMMGSGGTMFPAVTKNPSSVRGKQIKKTLKSNKIYHIEKEGCLENYINHIYVKHVKHSLVLCNMSVKLFFIKSIFALIVYLFLTILHPVTNTRSLNFI